MFSNAKILFEGLTESLLWRRINAQSKNARLLDKIDTTSTAANQLFSLTTINYTEPENDEREKETYNEIINDSFNDLESTKAIPIEKKSFNIVKKKKKYENLYYITSEEKRGAIFTRKLKPTPFQKNQTKYLLGKRNILIKQFLNRTSDIDGTILQNISLPNKNKNNKLINDSANVNLTYNNKKNKVRTTINKQIKNVQMYYNSKNIEYTENLIKKKHLDEIK